jgi:phospholipid/cholesterol/gamma-HCH transport system substrate-binding protein
MKREMKIGVFMAIAMLILTTFVFIVGDLSRLFRKQGYPVYVYFDSVAGLERRTVVRLAGVKIGHVQDIKLKGSQAEVELSINPNVKVREDSMATLATLGLLGEKYVEILPGREESFVQPEGRIKSIPSVGFDQLGTMLSSLGEDISVTSRALKDMIGGEESQANFKEILLNLSLLIGDLNSFFSENRPDMSRTLQDASHSVQRFDRRIEEVSRNLDELILLLKDMVEENRESLKGNMENIKELISRTEKALKLLNESLEKINRGEGSLGKLIHDPDMYHEAERTVNQAQQVLQAVSSVRLNVDLQSEYHSESELVKSYFTISFWPSPKKFLVAQIIRDPWLNRFTYSAQGGVRWGFLSPRAGIMESKFGVGVDYYAARDRLRFSLESFDFNRKPRPRFRAWTRFSVSRYISLLLGMDDFTLKPNREFYFGLSLGF